MNVIALVLYRISIIKK